MKIEMFELTDEEIEARDYRAALAIAVNDEIKFHVHDGEPEDSNLGRDFCDCWGVVDLMKMAYDAGKQGEDLDIVYTKGDSVV